MRHPQARTRLWLAMRRLGSWELRQLARESGQSLDTARTYTKSLAKAGYVVELRGWSPRSRELASYQLDLDTGPIPPIPARGAIKDPNLNPEHLSKWQKCWSAIRSLRDFNRGSLAACAEISLHSVGMYLRPLARVGYVEAVSTDGPAGNWRYRLVRDSGPLAPSLISPGEIYDPNTDEFCGETDD